MSETKRTRHINFRVTDVEYHEIEKAAVAVRVYIEIDTGAI
jgi:hypothetical protein